MRTDINRRGTRQRSQPRARSASVSFRINGRLVRPQNAKAPIDDWAFRYGWGAFDTLRIHRRRPLFLSQHLERLFTTAEILQLPRDAAPDDWVRDVYRVLCHARLAEGAVNLYWTGGIPSEHNGLRIVAARRSILPFSRPLRAWVAPWRIEPTMPGVGIKTMAYFPNVFASVCARNEGFEVALILNTDGRLADGAMTSVFLVEGDRISTPALSEGALAGITRGLVIKAAHELGITAREEPIPWRRVDKADALFLTSAIRGIATVRALGSKSVSPGAGSAAVSLITRLRRRYARMVAEQISSVPPAF